MNVLVTSNSTYDTLKKLCYIAKLKQKQIGIYESFGNPAARVVRPITKLVLNVNHRETLRFNRVLIKY
jgi:hypothetical protein